MKRVVIWAIIAYQRYIPSQYKRRCLFKESCSHFSIREIEQKGVLKGFRETITRLLRCRPGYKVVVLDGRFSVKLKNGEYVDEPLVSPSLLAPFKQALDSCEQSINSVGHRNC